MAIEWGPVTLALLVSAVRTQSPSCSDASAQGAGRKQLQLRHRRACYDRTFTEDCFLLVLAINSQQVHKFQELCANQEYKCVNS